MSKRNQLIGFILLLVLILPNSVVAWPGDFENRTSALTVGLGQLFELVADLIRTSGDLSSGIDPWGRATPPEDTTNDGDVGHGWDPWGSPAPPSGKDD